VRVAVGRVEHMLENFCARAACSSCSCWKRSFAAPCSSAPDSTKSRIALDRALRRGALSVAADGACATALYLAYRRSSEAWRVKSSVTFGSAAL
jgi:hypothetical protein